jgi:hypothetical protein
LGGLFASTLVPIGLGLRLAAGEADAAGQDQYVGGDGIPLLVVRSLHPMKELGEALVLA